MNTRYMLIVISLVCLTGLAACGGSEPVAVNPPPPQPQPQEEAKTPAPPAEMFLVGQLQDVDLEAKTFVLRDLKGTEQIFTLSPNTKVTGVASSQELSKREGSNATVRYVELDNLKSAVQIHVELGS